VLSKNKFWTLVATVVLLFTVYIADVRQVVAAVRSARPVYIAGTVVLGVFILFLRSRVWYVFFKNLGAVISSVKSFRLFSAGEFLNNVTPLGQAGGQPFMAYVVSDNTRMNYEEALATVISADFMTAFPLLSLGMVAGGYFLFVGVESQIVAHTVVFSLMAIVGGTVLVYMLWFKAGTVESVIQRVLGKVLWRQRWEEILAEKLDNVEKTFEAIGAEPRKLVAASVYAHLAFFVDMVVLYIVLRSLGYTPGLFYLFLAFPVANLSKSAPTAGGSGVYELALASILTVILSIDFSAAVAAAFLYRFSTYWVAIVVGYFALSGFTLPSRKTISGTK
jgi:uncharacterized protein (TIRG00374 family)